MPIISNKVKLSFFASHTHSVDRLSFTGEVNKPAHACRYLGGRNNSNLTLENILNSFSIKNATAISSLYLVREQVLLKEWMISSQLFPVIPTNGEIREFLKDH